MTSIMDKIKNSQRNNPYLQKVAGGIITEQSEKSADVSVDMVTGAENIPDVTTTTNTADIADMGKNVETAVNAPEAEITTTEKNEDNPDVQEILNAKDTVIKTASALCEVAKVFAEMPLSHIEAAFDKTASAVDFDNKQVFDLIEKSASAGNPVAQQFVDFVVGYNMTMEKIANDAASLVEQGVDPETAQAMAAESVAQEMGMAPAGEERPAAEAPVEANAEQAISAEIEGAVAELTTAVADTLVEEGLSPEEAQAVAEELVAEKIQEELEGDAMEAAEGSMSNEMPEGMEQTASAEDVAEEHAEEGVEDDALIEELAQASEIVAAAIMEENPDIDEETAGEIADELVINEVLGLSDEGEAEDIVENSPEVSEAVEEGEDEVGSVIEQLVLETAAEVIDANPEVSEEEAIELATAAVADALDTASEQQAIGATDENGEYLVPDDVAADSVEEMVKTASANPLRDYLTPVVAELFGIDQEAFRTRLG